MTETAFDDLDQQISPSTQPDPRALLAAWANNEAEWVRFLVGKILATGKPLGDTVVSEAYALFRQEKGLDPHIPLQYPF